MVATLGFALGLTLLAMLHLAGRAVRRARAPADATHARKRVDLAGTIRVVAGVSGLFALIFFATFNNFLGGVFMALMDAYGLSLMAVEAWGLLWALVSCAFILSGVVIARTGLGRNPLRTLLLVNLVNVGRRRRLHGPVLDSPAGRGLLQSGCSSAPMPRRRSTRRCRRSCPTSARAASSASPSRSSRPPRP